MRERERVERRKVVGGGGGEESKDQKGRGVAGGLVFACIVTFGPQ